MMDFFSSTTQQQQTKDDECPASPVVPATFRRGNSSNLPDKAHDEALQIPSVGSFDTVVSSSSSSTSTSSSEEGVEWTLSQSSYDDKKQGRRSSPTKRHQQAKKKIEKSSSSSKKQQRRHRQWLYALIAFSIVMLGIIGAIVIMAVNNKNQTAATASSHNLLGGEGEDDLLPQQQQQEQPQDNPTTSTTTTTTSQEEQDGQGINADNGPAQQSQDEEENGNNSDSNDVGTEPPVLPATSLAPTTAFPTMEPTHVPTLAPTEFRQGTVTMYAMGDLPYNANQAVLLQRYMAELADDASFVVHVGDMRSAATSAPCRWDEFTDFAETLYTSPAPVFVFIGDNDVHDCPDRDQGLEYWEANLDRFWEHWNTNNDGDAAAVVVGPVSQLAAVPGTWTFVHDQVLFIGVHLTQNVSPNVGLQTAWCIHLIRQYVQDLVPYTGRVVLFSHAGPDLSHHQSFFDDLSDFFENELKDDLPLLSVQGNTHVWDVIPSWYYGRPSWMKITVEGEAREAPTLLSISSTGTWQEPADAFQYTRRW